MDLKIYFPDKHHELQNKYQTRQIDKRCNNRHRHHVHVENKKSSNSYKPQDRYCRFTGSAKPRLSQKNPLIQECDLFFQTYHNIQNDPTIKKKSNYIPIWICNRCSYENIERKLYCSICNFKFSKSNSKYNKNYSRLNNVNNNDNKYEYTLQQYMTPKVMDEILNVSDTNDELLQIAIQLSLTDGNKQKNSRKYYKKARNKKRYSQQSKKSNLINNRKFSKSKPNDNTLHSAYNININSKTKTNKNYDFEFYWNEFRGKYRKLYNPNLEIITKIDNAVNNKQLLIKTEYGVISSYIEYLLFSKFSQLQSYIAPIKDIMKRLKASPNDYYSHYTLSIKNIFNAECMRRFATIIDRRNEKENGSKKKEIGLVFTYVNLDDLEETVCIKSNISNKHKRDIDDDNELIKYFGKDLLIYGYTRKYSENNGFPDDISNLVLLFYHMSGNQYKYYIDHTKNQNIHCFKLSGTVDRNIYICLARLWKVRELLDESWEYNDTHYHWNEGRDIPFYNLLPLYKITSHSHSKRYSLRNSSLKSIQKYKKIRYISRKWSAYYKLPY